MDPKLPQRLAMKEKIKADAIEKRAQRKADTEAYNAKRKADNEARVAAMRENHAEAGVRAAVAAAEATQDPVKKLSMLQMAEMSGLQAQWTKDGNPPEGLAAAYAELSLKHQQQHQDLAKGKPMEEVLNPLGHIDDLE